MTRHEWLFPALHRLRLLRGPRETSCTYEPKHAIPTLEDFVKFDGREVKHNDTEYEPVTLPPLPGIYGGKSVIYRGAHLWVGGVKQPQARRA